MLAFLICAAVIAERLIPVKEKIVVTPIPASSEVWFTTLVADLPRFESLVEQMG